MSNDYDDPLDDFLKIKKSLKLIDRKYYYLICYQNT